MSEFNFTCPYCDRAQTATSASNAKVSSAFDMTEGALGHIALRGTAVICANPDCQQPTVIAEVCSAVKRGFRDFVVPKEPKVIKRQRLMPDSQAKTFPDYIPEVLREDYVEACVIRDLSPKASATLSRRCLQGMIRDFTGIKEKTLFQEIEKLRELVEESSAPKGVSEDSIESLHHVRGLGNIGAHMEKDINVIIPVDPSEAQILIELIESLFDEWYVQRQKRQDRFAALREAAEQKQALRDESKE